MAIKVQHIISALKIFKVLKNMEKKNWGAPSETVAENVKCLAGPIVGQVYLYTSLPNFMLLSLAVPEIRFAKNF